MISIHAPLRGATRLVDPVTKETLISIHAPLRGATEQVLACTTAEISIHAPLRGATLQ